jgi:hypothetical protein
MPMCRFAHRHARAATRKSARRVAAAAARATKTRIGAPSAVVKRPAYTTAIVFTGSRWNDAAVAAMPQCNFSCQ